MSKHVVIVGGGIIGMCSAYYLQKEGHQVAIVDPRKDLLGFLRQAADKITSSLWIRDYRTSTDQKPKLMTYDKYQAMLQRQEKNKIQVSNSKIRLAKLDKTQSSTLEVLR